MSHGGQGINHGNGGGNQGQNKKAEKMAQMQLLKARALQQDSGPSRGTILKVKKVQSP